MLTNTARATELMRHAGLDAVIATSPSNVQYLSDAEFVSMRSHPNVQIYAVATVDAPDSPALVLPNHEVDPWAEQPGSVQSVSVYGRVFRRTADVPLADDDALIRTLAIDADPAPSAIEALASAIRGMGLSSSVIGVDESHTSPHVWQSIVDSLPNVRIEPCASLFQQIRMVKTDEEIRRLRRSAEITAAGIDSVFSAAEPGVSEAELASIFKQEVSKQGATPEFWLISGGRRTGHTHTRQSGYRLKSGDLLKVDAGCTYEFYWSDLARTKVVGEADAYRVGRYALLCDAVIAGGASVRPGARASEVFDTAIGHVREGGIDDYDRHHAGHGIGIEVYDPPLIQATGRPNMFGIADLDPALEVGMVVNVETPYYELGSFGMIVEDTMVVVEGGAELLAPMPYSLELSNT